MSGLRLGCGWLWLWICRWCPRSCQYVLPCHGDLLIYKFVSPILLSPWYRWQEIYHIDTQP